MKIEERKCGSSKGVITLFKLTNALGHSVTLSTVGAGIVSIVVPDKNGHLDDVVLGYSNPADYFYDGSCAGKVPGRYANRIAKGKFTLDGHTYQLRINNGPNALHGGPEGFSHKIWNAEQVDDSSVAFSLVSPDGDENYPGELRVSAIYTWTDDDELVLRLSARSNKDTIVNLTNHTYFNLAGENSGSVLNQKLQLRCSRYLPTDDTLIPTGEIADVNGTPMDFTVAKALGQDINVDFPALKYGKGYDNCWVIDDWDVTQTREVATLVCDETGRKVVVSTNQPAVQVYTGNWLAGSPKNKGGNRSYNDYDGVAIECQGMPDAPNHDNFPSQALHVNDIYERMIIFKFSVN